MVDLSNELQSHSIDSRNYPSPKSEVVRERKSIQQIPFNTCLDGHIGYASDFKLVIVAVASSTPIGGNFLSKFIFPEFFILQIFCQIFFQICLS